MSALADGIAFDNGLKAITNLYRALLYGPEKKAFKLRELDHVTFTGIFIQETVIH